MSKKRLRASEIEIEQALEPFDCLPWATMSGIGGWSFGNQSAGPKRALIWATVNDNGLPSSVRGVFAGSTGSPPGRSHGLGVSP